MPETASRGTTQLLSSTSLFGRSKEAGLTSGWLRRGAVFVDHRRIRCNEPTSETWGWMHGVGTSRFSLKASCGQGASKALEVADVVFHRSRPDLIVLRVSGFVRRHNHLELDAKIVIGRHSEIRQEVKVHKEVELLPLRLTLLTGKHKIYQSGRRKSLLKSSLRRKWRQHSGV
jgi:hypothetical protein